MLIWTIPSKKSYPVGLFREVLSCPTSSCNLSRLLGREPPSLALVHQRLSMPGGGGWIIDLPSNYNSSY